MRKVWTLFSFVVIFILISSIPAGAASPSETAANQPWTIQTLDNDEPNVLNLSSAFGGKYQIPMFSYYRTDSNALALVHQGTNAVPGHLGPDSSWVRVGIPITTYGPIDGTISNLDTFLYGSDTFGVKWVFGTNAGKLRGITYEFQNDMTYMGGSSEVLVELEKFGDYLVGAPSLQADGRWFRFAFTTFYSGEETPFPEYRLVYVHKTGEENDSCLLSGTSFYQCDIIESTNNSMGPPSLQATPNGNIGIAYEFDEYLKYGYPHDHSFAFPSNCGPGNPETWRCIVIENATTISGVQLAFGQSQGRGIVYSLDNNDLFVAQYVGTGGNCGQDGPTEHQSNRWKCLLLTNIGFNPDPSFAIAIDPLGYPVIAYDNPQEELGPKNLSIVYPLGHIGLEPIDGWRYQVIDPSPNMNVDNGGQVSIALNSAGLGFMAYRQNDGYYYTDPLRIAIQWFKNYLPIVVD